jgi:diguanylate cyclase (GGDEF)-like protein
MSEAVVAGRPARGGLTPLAVAALSVVVVTAWLALRRPGDVVLGYAGGPPAMLAAAYTCRRIGAMVLLPRPVRAFWRRLAQASFILLAGAVTSLVLANNDAGMSLFVAGPMVLGVFWTISAFVGLPLSEHGGEKAGGVAAGRGLFWARLALDGATVAVAGALIFWYVVLSFVPPGVDLVARDTAGAVGVAGLLALVVMGRAAMSPAGQVDPRALRVMAVAPVVTVAAAVLLIAGSPGLRLAFSVLAVPVVATAMALAAYCQHRALGRSPDAAPAKPARSIYNLLPYLAVTASAALVITVSAREMSTRDRAVIGGAALIAACVVARQLLGLRDNRRLVNGLREQQEEMRRLALTDPLTGLANRHRFGVVLAERLAAHRPATVLLIDIDDFKMINDTMGPALGDQLLYQVAQRLRLNSAVRELPARLGGDEFAVLLDIDDVAGVENAAVRLQQALGEPLRVGEHQLLAQASIGVAVAGPGDNADEVLRNADIAMYAAKEAGKAGWVRFEPRMRQEVVNHARLGSELHNAIIRHELFLLYQPVFDIVTGRLHGAEALVRWQHPVRGFVSPGDFIPVAERSGLIVPLGSYVLREACTQLAAWRREHGDGAIKAINVNVAVRQLREPGFVDEVAAVLSETGLLPVNLVLEVTESSVADGRQVRETLQALHDMGVRLALDDFGTGASSLSLLRAFPVDVLKLDKSFVDGIADGEDRGRLAVAAAVAQLAEYLQLSAVAEGIETEVQLDRLRAMGYRLGQGFYMAKPLPADAAGALMAAGAPVLPGV